MIFIKKKKYTPQNMMDFIEKNITKNVPFVLAGGAIPDIINNQKPKDLDIFFGKEEHLQEVNNSLSQDFQLSIETDNAISYNHISGITVQLIKKHFGTGLDITSNFDLTCSMRWIDSNSNTIHENPMYSNKITIKKYHADTLNRVIKYLRKGYELDLESLKIALKEISKLNKLTLYYGNGYKTFKSDDALTRMVSQLYYAMSGEDISRKDALFLANYIVSLLVQKNGIQYLVKVSPMYCFKFVDEIIIQSLKRIGKSEFLNHRDRVLQAANINLEFFNPEYSMLSTEFRLIDYIRRRENNLNDMMNIMYADVIDKYPEHII